MKKEDFLRDYIDNELSEAGKKKFSALIENDSELKQELNNLIDMEKSLNESKMTLRDSDIAFLAGFKTNLIENIKNQPASKFSPVNWKELIHNYAFILTFGILFFIGSIASYFYTNEVKIHHQIAYKPLNLDNTAKIIEEKSVTNELKANKDDILISTKETNTKEKTQEPLITSSEKNEITLSIKEKNILTNQELIDKLKADLENFEKSNDIFNTAVTKKRLGQIYGKLQGKTEEAKTLLIQSATAFEKLKYSEMQAECYGELALIELQLGNKTNAEDYIGRCIQFLEKNNSKKLKYWQDIYEKNFK
ncbi:MAG: hypothetical protein N2319_07365 [Candidatus Kapabacteria bacterium]|nr:hypothetical protein [Candidatus Kapabacteria bacterium]